MGGAQAADLPVKAKAVEYVKICSLYGAGFYYIPGTDTCIKLGGYLRVETALNTNSVYSGGTPALGGAHNQLQQLLHRSFPRRLQHRYAHRDRIRRGPHLLRCDLLLDHGWLYRHRQHPGLDRLTGSAAGDGAGAPRRPRERESTAASRAVRSACTTPSSSSPASRWVRPCRSSTRPGSTIPATTSTVWSAAAARSLVSTSSPTPRSSATACRWRLSAQDSVAYGQAGVQNLDGRFDGGIQGGAYGVEQHRRHALLLTSSRLLRVDQAWGLFQASFAAHENHAGYYGATEIHRSSRMTSGVGLLSWPCRSRTSRRALATR